MPEGTEFGRGLPAVPCSFIATDIVLSARSYHGGLVNALLADGAVRSIADSVYPVTYKDLGSRAGGEIPGEY